MYLILLNETFLVNTVSFVDANVELIIVFCNFVTCNFHFNFVFICNFKIKISILKMRRISFKLITHIEFFWISIEMNQFIFCERKCNFMTSKSRLKDFVQFFSCFAVFFRVYSVRQHIHVVYKFYENCFSFWLFVYFQ